MLYIKCTRAVLSTPERVFLGCPTGLASSNPFLPEHSAFERAALGADFVGEPVWSVPVDEPGRPRANIWLIAKRLDLLVKQLDSASIPESRLTNATSGSMETRSSGFVSTLLPAVLRRHLWFNG